MGRKPGGTRKGMADPLINLEPGDNTKAIQLMLDTKKIGYRKVNFKDIDEVQERVFAYFQLVAEYDKKPTVNGLAMSLGVDRKTLYEVIHNKPSHRMAERYGYTENGAAPAVKEFLNWAYQVMATLWETYMQEGKINPASGIFLGKNFYGMRDEVEHVITPSHDPADDYNADDIAKRYIAESSDKSNGTYDEGDVWDDDFVPPDDPWDDIPPE